MLKQNIQINVFKLLLLISYFVIASWTLARDLNYIEFQHISTEHGLSQKTVLTIFQDNNGFLWLGTQEGLNRYDGRKLKVFRHAKNDPKTISHDFIRDILEDKLGNLWIATRGGLNKFIQTDESFISIELESNYTPNTLFVDDLGVIWIGTNGGGIFTLDPKQKKYEVKRFNNFNELLNKDVREILQDSRGRMWIGTDANGLFQINFETNKLQHFQKNLDKKKSISHNRIKTIIEDHKGQIWVGTKGGGVNKFNELSKTFDSFINEPNNKNSLSNNRVNKIFEDINHRIWVATDNGLNIYQHEKSNFIRIQHSASHRSSLNNNRVLSIFQDKSRLVWFGTQSGLNKWNPTTAKFVHYRHSNETHSGLTHNHIHGFAENFEGIIYIATYGGGLNYFNPKVNEFGALHTETGLSEKYLTTLMVDNRNQLWVGTLSQGVSVLSKENIEIDSFSHRESDPSSLSANGVTDILQDSDGEIWISTYRAGLNRKQQKSNGFTRYMLSNQKDGLTNENIFQVIEDDEGYIWMTTDGGGIFRLDKNTNKFTNFTQEDGNSKSLSANNTTTIFQDSKGRFWIGTQGNGLNRWEPENRRRGINIFKHYNVRNGLNSSTINGVLEDAQGYLWVSTIRGVSRLNPDNDEIRNYNLADEIHGNELNHAASIQASTGRLYFGGLEGISAFFPDEIKQNSHQPNVLLTNISSEGRQLELNAPLSQLKEIVFEHKDYLVTFEFAGLDFSQPKKNQYQYMLEGLDSDWVNIGNLNRATFTNLPSGSYTLKVKGSNNDGLWSDESINLKVNVLPAPWASWWAYSIYAALFSLVLLLVIRSQAKRLANQEMFRSLVSEQVEEKTGLYVKNNEFLNEQMERIKFHSNIDLDTGLPNQKYLCDLVNANLQWVNQYEYKNDSNCPKLCTGLFRLPKTGNVNAIDDDALIAKIAKTFNEKVNQLEIGFKVVVRWGEKELGVLYYADNEAEGERLMALIVSELISSVEVFLSHDFTKQPIKTAFVLSPFSGVKQDEIGSSDLLMLTEHLLHLVSNDPELNVFGIFGSNQKLNPSKFRQIMMLNNINKLKDVFVVSE